MRLPKQNEIWRFGKSGIAHYKILSDAQVVDSYVYFGIEPIQKDLASLGHDEEYNLLADKLHKYWTPVTPTQLCAQCDGECPQDDYLCEECRHE